MFGGAWLMIDSAFRFRFWRRGNVGRLYADEAYLLAEIQFLLLSVRVRSLFLQRRRPTGRDTK
jgi:hypothetical protein